MTNRVFLLGAGFSKLAGLPLANELVNFLQNHLNTSNNTRDIDFRKEFSDFIIGINPSLWWVFGSEISKSSLLHSSLRMVVQNISVSCLSFR